MDTKARNSCIESLFDRPPAGQRTKDLHFVRRFEALTGVQVRKAAAPAIPRSFLGRQIQPPEELAQRYCYELQPRTYNALRRHSAPSRQPWTFGRLLDIRGFGIYSLLDLLEVLAKDATTLEASPHQGTG